MTNPDDSRESFRTRHRRSIALALWLGGLVAIVVLYNVTMPKPTVPQTAGGGSTADLPTIQVGALPVT